MRRASALLAGIAAAGGLVLVVRRRRFANSERVDLYYEDGSVVSHERGAPDGERLLAVAREALAAVRGAA